MEKITEEFDWDCGLNSKNIYNWDEILNGDTNQLKRGVDFQINVKSFVRQARHIARRRGLGFKNRKIDENTVVVRAFEYEKGEGPREGREDPLYPDFIKDCRENAGGLVSGNRLGKKMDISWDRVTKMIRIGQEDGFIGEKMITEGNVKGYRIFGDKLEEIILIHFTFGVKSTKEEPDLDKALEAKGITHSQIANVKGGVYVN